MNKGEGFSLLYKLSWDSISRYLRGQECFEDLE